MSSLVYNIDFWGAVASIIIFEFIYLPLGAYYTRKYRKFRNHTILKARYSTIALWEANIAIFKFIYSPSETIAFYLWGPASSITRCITALGIYAAHFLFYIMTWRIWLLYYDLRWTKIITDSEWKRIIDPKHRKTKSESWFIRNKSTFGNIEWTKWKVLISAFISGTTLNAIGIVAGIYYPNTKMYYRLWLLGDIPLLYPSFLMIYIYYQLIRYKFEDNFYIRYEIGLLSIAFCIQYLGDFGLNGVMAFDPNLLNEEQHKLLSLIMFQFVLFAQFLAVMISTCCILRKVRGIIEGSRYNTRSSTLTEADTPSTVSPYSADTPPSYNMGLLPSKYSNDSDPKSVEIIEIFPDKKRKYRFSRVAIFDSITSRGSGSHTDSIGNSNAKTNWTLIQVLAHETGFEYFIRHLSREISVECLLSLIEFVHFETYIVSHSTDLRSDAEQLWGGKKTLSFPNSVPKSHIVYGTAQILQLQPDASTSNFDVICRRIAMDLWIKYVSDGSEFQINISSSLRQEAQRIVNSEECTRLQLLTLFNKLSGSQLQLMSDAYARFRYSNQFQRLQCLFFL